MPTLVSNLSKIFLLQSRNLFFTCVFTSMWRGLSTLRSGESATFLHPPTSNPQKLEIILRVSVPVRQTYSMKTTWLLPFLSFAFLFSAAVLPAQDKPAQSPQNSASLFAYDLNREVTLVGTVLSYSAASKTSPAGPRVTLQTRSGVFDIHLGDARLLAANQFTIQQGDTLRIVGENIAFSGGMQFVSSHHSKRFASAASA